MQPSCTEPNQLDTKGKREEEREKEGKREEKERGERRKIEEKEGEKKERKRRGKRGFLQKNRILQIFVGII